MGRFLPQSEEAYVTMNEAFANGDRVLLEELCTPSMYQKLKSQLKDRIGRYEWKYHGVIEKPQIVSVRQGQLAGYVLVQIIVRLHTNQVRGRNYLNCRLRRNGTRNFLSHSLSLSLDDIRRAWVCTTRRAS